MTSISSTSAGIASGTPLPGNDGAAADARAQAAQSTARVRELLDAFVGMAGSLPTGKTAGPSPAGDGLFNGNGAPALEPPAQSFSANDMIDLLRSIRSKSDEAQISSAKENLSAARTKMEKNNEAQLQKIQDYVKKCEEAASKGILGKIFGWIGKIAALVFSAIAVAVLAAGTVASGGGRRALAGPGGHGADQFDDFVGRPDIQGMRWPRNQPEQPDDDCCQQIPAGLRR
ncbi:MAG: type III secretion system translocon subunit SctE [Achromobacter xylosoxidans]